MTGPIVHISADFPDSFDYGKTKAISTLIDMVGHRFDQRVISLNRQSPNLGDMVAIAAGNRDPIADRNDDNTLLSLKYLGFPKGVLHRTMLHRLADRLYDHLSLGERPALILGHKLTVEGIVAAEIARRFAIPYGLTIQGKTDAKLLATRPDLRTQYAKIFRDASIVFSLAPWSLRATEAVLGPTNGATICLPCPVAMNERLAPSYNGTAIHTAFHLRHHRGKNLGGLVGAHSILRKSRPQIDLHIIGGGDPRSLAQVERLTRGRAGILLRGPIPNTQMGPTFNTAIGFAMPSLRESFGMVFIEALFSGTPILYPCGQAVDGYFDAMPFAIAVDPRDQTAIADGLERLVRDEIALKKSLAAWQCSGAAERFGRAAIAQAFGDGMAGAIATGTGGKPHAGAGYRMPADTIGPNQ